MIRNYVFFLSLSSLLIFCQDTLVSGQGFLISQVRTLEVRNSNNKSYSDIEGSPYYSKDFINSTIFLRNGNYANIPLRYDLYQDQMEFNKDGKILWLNLSDINYIKYGQDTLYVSSVEGDTNKLGYFFLKDSGSYLLFFKRPVIFEPLVPPEGYTETIPDRFKPGYELIFIKQEKNPAVRIRNKKDLLNYFTENQGALDFIKKEKIRADKIDDLHRLITWLNNKKN